MAVSALRGPIKVGDLTPELIPALVVIRDGEEVVLRGYVNSRRCPGRVKSAVASAARAYAEAAGTTFNYAAYIEQLRELLLSVIVGIEEDEADTLAGDMDDEAGAVAVLRLLKWRDDEPAASDEDDADPEAPAESSIMAKSSQSSRRSTTSDQPSS